jgi:threonine dehydrogenase-like Zn-dependent dehydrogenase
MMLGYTVGLGSGWSEQVVAHDSQLYTVPAGVTDTAAALVEPLSVMFHCLLRRPPKNGSSALVVGAGSVGLAAIAALGSLVPDSPVTVVVRHENQARVAKALGAERVVFDGPDVLGELAERSGGKIRGRGRGASVCGGFSLTIEATGSGSGFDTACRATHPRCPVYLAGCLGKTEIDLAPAWFKELDLVGSFAHGTDVDRYGRLAHSFERAIELIVTGRFPEGLLVTHTFPLSRVHDAIATAHDRRAGALKVQLVPSEPYP